MLTTLLFLCAQTPVQHELDMIPFEHLMNHKVEAEKLREDRMALDMLAWVTQSSMPPIVGEGASLEESFAAIAYDWSFAQVVQEIESERQALPEMNSWGLLFGQENRGPFHSSGDVLDSLKTYMEPAFDSKRESLKVDQTANGRVLLAYLQPSQSEWLHEFFDLQKETQTWTALVNAHIFVGGTEWLDANGFAEQATPFLNEGTMGVIVDALRGSSLEEMVNPRILMNPGMDGSLSVLTEFSYVEEWQELIVQPGDVSVLDPSIETVEEGLTMDVRVLQVASDQYGLDISYELMDLIQPMKTEQLTLGGVSCRTASPEVITTSLESNLVIPSGGGAVFRTTRSSDQKEIVLVIQFQRVDVDAEN